MNLNHVLRKTLSLLGAGALCAGAFWLGGCGSGGNGIPPNTTRLEEGMVIGTPTAPINQDGTRQDCTASGGQINCPTVDGLSCGLDTVNYHIHAHLSLFVNGVQVAIPKAIGTFSPIVQSNFVVNAGCFYPLHTHDETGIIHVEAPAPGTFTLGQFFDIWKQTLSSTAVAGFNGPVTAFIGSQPYTGDLRSITLTPFEEITLEVGTPVVTPPNYFFPESYYTSR